MQHYNVNKLNLITWVKMDNLFYHKEFFLCYGVFWSVKFTHYTVGNEGSVQDEVQDIKGNVQMEMKYAEGSEQELVAPDNIRLTDSSTATTLMKKTSDNTKSMAMNFCYIFFGFCSIVCYLTSFHTQMFSQCMPLHTYTCRTGCAKHVNVIWAMKWIIQCILHFAVERINTHVMKAIRHGRVRMDWKKIHHVSNSIS